MANISSKEIKHIAELARIEINEAEIKKFSRELSAILDFVEALQKSPGIKTGDGEQIMGLENIFRQDKEHNLLKEKGKILIEQAPNKKDSFVEVPEILKRDEKI